MNKSPLKQSQAGKYYISDMTVDGQNPNTPTTNFDASNVTINNQQMSTKVDDYASVYKEMKTKGFKDNQIAYVLKNMKAKKDYEAAVKAEQERLAALKRKQIKEARDKKLREEQEQKEKEEAAKKKEKLDKIDEANLDSDLSWEVGSNGRPNFKTFVNKKENDVIDAFNKRFKYANVTIQPTATMNPFNQNEIMVTGDGINPMKIDLNPWTDGGAVEVEKQLNQLYDQLIKQEKERKQDGGRHKNLFAGKDTSGRLFDIISGDRPTQLSFTNEDLASVNEGYKDYGIEIKHVDNADGKSYYQIYKNGEPQIPEPKYPNPPGLNVIGVQEWLSNNDNWTEEERVAWADNNVKAVEEEVENRKKIQERVYETISDEQIELEYKKSNQRLIDAEIAFEKISDDAKKIIQSHLTTPINKKDGSFEEEENWEATKFDSLFSDEVRDQLSEEDQIIFDEVKQSWETPDEETGKTVQENSIERLKEIEASRLTDVEYSKSLRNNPNRAFIKNSLEASHFSFEEEEEIMLNDLNDITENYKEDIQQDFNYAEDVFSLAKKDGVGVEVKTDSDGNRFYVATGENEDAVIKHQEQFNKIRHREKLNRENYTTRRQELLKKYNLRRKAYQDNEGRMIDIAKRETDLGEIMTNEFQDAVQSLGYSVPYLFGSDSAMSWYKSNQRGKEAYEQAIDFNTARATGQKGRYSAISIAQQAPNVMLAVATSGIGTSVGVGALGMTTKAAGIMASGITSTAFGISSGTNKHADLTIQQQGAEAAEEKLKELEANKAYMSHAEYLQTKGELNEQIAYGDLSNEEILAASLASGVIEGGVAFALGTIPNASKMMQGIVNSPADDMLKAIYLGNGSYIARAGLEMGKRTLGEIAEEGIIHFGDAASESLILGREFNIDGWEDVVVSSILTGGLMNVPSVGYSALTMRLATADHRKAYIDTKSDIEQIKKKLTNPALTTEHRQTLRSELADKARDYYGIMNDIEVGGMLLGGEGTAKLLQNGKILDGLYKEAGILPSDSQEVKQRKLKEHSEKLGKISSEDQNEFDTLLKDAQDRKNNILQSVNYKEGWKKIWGDRGDLLHQKLMKENADYKLMDDRQKTAFVHKTIKEQIDAKRIADVRKNKDARAYVNSRLYPNGKPKGRPTKAMQAVEDNAYREIARNLWGQNSENIMRSVDQEVNAKSVLGDKRLSELTIIDVSDNGFEHDIRKMEQNGELREGEDADQIIAKLKQLQKETEAGKTFGAIVGNKYITTNSKAAAVQLNEGNLLQGTVWSHEVKHATDALAFNEAEMNDYSSNLEVWAKENAMPAHMEAWDRLKRNNYLVVGDDGNYLPMNQQPPLVHKEYGNYIQDALYRDENKQYRDKLNNEKASVGNVLRGLVRADFAVDSPSNAAKYLADHMKAFDKGDMSTLAKRRADKRKGAIDPETGTRRSSDLQGMLEQNYAGENSTRADVRSLVDNLLNNDFNGEPMVGGSQQLSAFDFQVGGILESITKRLYDKIPMSQRGIVSRDDYKNSLKTEAVRLLTEEYDPSKQDMDKFLSTRLNLRANSLASDLGITSNFNLDVDEAKGIYIDDDTDIDLDDEGNEIADETEFSDGLGFTPEALTIVLDHVKLNLGGILPSISAEKGKNATVSPLVSELKKLFYKEKNPIQQEIEKLMGSTPAEVEIWLKDPKNKALILKYMPTTWLAKNLPKAVQKLVIQEDGTKIWTTDFVGRKKGTKPGQVDFYRSTDDGPYKGMTDGKQKIRRNPKAMTEVDSIEIIRKFFNGKTMTDLRRGGLNTLTQAMAQEIGLEQFRAGVVKNNDIGQMFASRQELLHGEIADNLAAKAIDQVERGAVLRSEGKLPQKFFFDLGLNEDVIGRTLRIGFSEGVDSKIFRDALSELEGQMPGISSIIEPLMEEMTAGNITKENIGLLKQIKDNTKISPLLKDRINKAKDHILRDANKKTNSNAVRYNNAIKTLVNEYGIDKGMIDALGGDAAILGYFNRALDAAENSKKYNGKAPFYADKIAVLRALKNIATGFNPKDIMVMNKKNTVLKNTYSPLLHSNMSDSDKLAHLASISPRLNAASISNIGHLKHIVDTVNQAVKDGKMDPVDALVFFQIQTNITSGIRALSGLDYFMFGNFIDGTKFKNISPDIDLGTEAYATWLAELQGYDFYKERYDFNKAKFSQNPDLTEAQIERAANDATYKDLLIKGEHIGAQANTSADLLSAILDGSYNDDTFASIVEDHTQFFGPNFVMDMLDDTLGKTSRDSHLRITKSLQSRPDILNKVYHVSGKPAVEAVAAKRFTVRSSGELNNIKILENAAKQKRLNTENKGISVLDFDDTLATSKSLIRYERPDGTKGTLTPEEYAAKYEDLADLGYTFDFSEFNDVIQGKIAPLFNKALKLAKKYGTNDIYILTARPAAAQKAIFNFLKENGLELPIENIVGLGNSTAEAKALWIADKAAEGYNDFYFADDALKNVQAVSNMLDQFDVKQKTTVADPNFVLKSSDAATTLNSMIARNLGIAEYKNYSDAKAKLVGGKKGKYKFFVPPSAEDFKGLLYPLLGKGAQGDADMKFFKDHFFDPFSRGMHQINVMAQNIARDHRALNKALPDAKKKLKKKIPGTEFTHGQAVKVYMWTKAGVDIPGLSKADQKIMMEAVQADPKLMEYANGLTKIVKSPSYIEPTDTWLTSTIAQDLAGMTQNVNRKEMLAEFIENRKAMFGDWKNGRLDGPLMNKLEAELGSNWRSAMEDMLWRMENGSNRNFGTNALTNRFANWVNNSVGAIMFFNGRSAVLQTLSTVNFINWSDNNVLMAAKAFANQPQYWKDFAYLFNSDMLKQRRAGNRRSVSESELAEAAAQGGPQAVFKKLLDLGFLPTQIADSFAISAGGATFYRNRINSLIKQGMSRADAEAQAFTDFQKITEETQQSSRPDMISQQQASPLGRLILAFQNTPMQYTRLTKKAILDLKNGRGDAKTNISKIIYYGAMQNIIFSALQSAMFKFMFDDEDEEEEKRKRTTRMANSVVDSFLRGTGVTGAIAATLKNMVLKFIEEDKKGFRMSESAIMVEMLNLSPPIGSKMRKIRTGLQTYKFNRNEIDYMSKWDFDNPMWSTVALTVSALTNIPLDRAYQKITNLKEASNSDHETWQRIALMLGWNTWDLGVENQALKNVEEGIKAEKEEQKRIEKEAEKKEKERKRKEREARMTQCTAHTRKGKGPRCKNMTENKSGKCYAHQ